MTILDLVETWARAKGWWTFKNPETGIMGPRAYINISMTGFPPFEESDWATLYADCTLARWVGRDDVKLRPADPDFFADLERLMMEMKYENIS